MWKYNYSDMSTQNSLCHYGVMGMRWGVRKDSYYDKRATINKRKVDKSKTTAGKLIATNRQYTNQYYAQKKRDFKNAKGWDKLGERYGHRRSAKILDQQSKMNMQASKIAKTKLGSQAYSVKSWNEKVKSDYHKDMHNTKIGVKRLGKFIDAYFNIPTKRLSGRQLTNGQQMTEYLIPGLSMVKDISYMRNNKGEFGKNRRK